LGRVAQQNSGAVGSGWIAVAGLTYANQGYAGSWGGASVLTDPRGTPIWHYNDASLRLTKREVYLPTTGGLSLQQRMQWVLRQQRQCHQHHRRHWPGDDRRL